MGLRWTLGVIAALFGAGWFALMTIAEGFRRSFGASPAAPVLSMLPAVVAALVVASVLWPGGRPLLHVTAAGVLLLTAGCLWIAKDAPLVATLGVLYSAMWLTFYWRAAWRS